MYHFLAIFLYLLHNITFCCVLLCCHFPTVHLHLLVYTSLSYILLGSLHLGFHEYSTS